MVIRVGRASDDSDSRRRDWLPVSTTHMLSSGVAGTMAANRSGLQRSTIGNLAMAWVLTLLAAILISGSLCWIFVHLF